MSSTEATSVGWTEFARRLVRVESDRWDFACGARAVMIILVPLIIGLWTHLEADGVLTTLGTLNLLMVTAPRPTVTRLRVLGLACVVNAVAFAAGTFIATLPELFAAPFVVLGVALALLLGADRERVQVALIAAVVFVVGVGLPDASLSVLLPRFVFIAVGGAWACAAIIFTRWYPRPTDASTGQSKPTESPNQHRVLFRELLPHVAPVALAAGFGFLIGAELHLPRDFWIMLTVLVALRPDLYSTFAYASMRILGTIGGATVALVISTATNDVWFLGAALAAAGLVMFASRSVNYIVFAFALTIFVILLLDLAFAGGPYLAQLRILDTVIGGVLALVTGSLLWLAETRRARRKRSGSRSDATGTPMRVTAR